MKLTRQRLTKTYIPLTDNECRGIMPRHPIPIREFGVTADPFGRELIRLAYFINEVTGDLRFCLKDNIFQNQVVLASLLLFFGKPALRHIQPAGQKTITLPAGVANEDAGLAVICFAKSGQYWRATPADFFPFLPNSLLSIVIIPSSAAIVCASKA
jgi:hypothetical protein